MSTTTTTTIMVDIVCYRCRIGTFCAALRCRNANNLLGCESVATLGAVGFIGMLLFMAGIELNPGPPSRPKDKTQRKLDFFYGPGAKHSNDQDEVPTSYSTVDVQDVTSRTGGDIAIECAAKKPRLTDTEEGNIPLSEIQAPDHASNITTSSDVGQTKVFDIGCVLEEYKLENIDDELKYKIMMNHFAPDQTFIFPTTKHHGCNRRCKLDLLDNNFVYSKQFDSVYCLPCALFVPPGDKRDTLKSFVNIGYRSWPTVHEKRIAHTTKKYHELALKDVEFFKSRFETPKSTLPHVWNKELTDRHNKYQTILVSIARAVHFCGKQGLAFRGHRESISVDDPSENPGNFLALLREYSKTDKVLEEHMRQPLAKNANYMRPMSQNEMIDVIGQHIIQADIISEIKAARFHTVMCDEVTASNDETLSLCFRFVDNELNIREEFLEFISISRITGTVIAESILTFYKTRGLDIHHMRGQCYDGASNMSGAKKGVAAVIAEHTTNAPYTHCNCHILNLSIASSCKDTHVQHVLATMTDVAIFINYSPKRERLLEMVVNKRESSSSTRKVIVGLCKTRWSERDKAYEHFYLAIPFLVEAFEIINGTHPEICNFDDQYVTGWDSNSKREATARLKALCDFGLIIGVVSVYHLLHPLRGITVNLQGRNIDIVKAYSMVNETISDLKAVRSDINKQFKNIFDQAVRLAEKICVTPSLPRIVKRQTNRQNTPADTPEEYWRRTIAIPLLDRAISEMHTRFDHTSQTAVKLLCLVPSIICSNLHCDIDDAVNMYTNDLPSADVVCIELTSWRAKWERVAADDRPSSLASAIKACDESRFPNLFILLKIACTLGVTSCECERSFSTLRRLKSWLRSSMGTHRLSSLALMSIHYGHDVSYERAVKLFMQLHPRRLQLANIILE